MLGLEPVGGPASTQLLTCQLESAIQHGGADAMTKQKTSFPWVGIGKAERSQQEQKGRR